MLLQYNKIYYKKESRVFFIIPMACCQLQTINTMFILFSAQTAQNNQI